MTLTSYLNHPFHFNFHNNTPSTILTLYITSAAPSETELLYDQ